MRRVHLMIAGFALGLALIATCIGFAWSRRSASAGTGDAAPPIAVHVALVKQGGLERTVTRPGTLHAFQYADLYAMVSGYLRRQVVDIGSPVKKGQVLAEVYAPQLETDVQEADASLQKAQAQVKVMQARIRVAAADLREAKVKVEQAEADLLNAAALLNLRKKQYQRIKRLVEANSVEKELADEKYEAQQAALSNEHAQRKAVETAKVAVTTAEARASAADANLADAQAQVGIARAARARAQIMEDFTRLRSPYDGVITRRSYHDGDFVHKGGDHDHGPILTVARTDLMRVIVDVPDLDVPYTHAGARAEVRVTSLPGRVFTGAVARTAMSEAYNSRTMRTEVDLPNPKNVLTEGMFGNVMIFLGADPNTLTIPSAALVGPEQDGERSVYVVRADHAHLAKVHVRRDDGIHAEIDHGLDVHEPVVVSRGPGLHDGAPVAVKIQ